MSSPGFAAGQIEELLIDLATRAALDGRTGAIRVVGGSVIALMNTDRRATRDIDAVLAPADQLLDIAHDMARLRGLRLLQQRARTSAPRQIGASQLGQTDAVQQRPPSLAHSSRAHHG